MRFLRHLLVRPLGNIWWPPVSHNLRYYLLKGLIDEPHNPPTDTSPRYHRTTALFSSTANEYFCRTAIPRLLRETLPLRTLVNSYNLIINFGLLSSRVYRYNHCPVARHTHYAAYNPPCHLKLRYNALTPSHEQLTQFTAIPLHYSQGCPPPR